MNTGTHRRGLRLQKSINSEDTAKVNPSEMPPGKQGAKSGDKDHNLPGPGKEIDMDKLLSYI